MTRDQEVVPGMPNAKPDSPPQPLHGASKDSRGGRPLSNAPWAQALVENLNRNALKEVEEKK